ncbi:RETN protein, partial [Crocuta crocuta]
MKALPLLPLLLAGLALLVCGRSLCPVEEAINEKVHDASHAILETVRTLGLSCRTVTSRGDLATCPSGECRSPVSRLPVIFLTTCHCQCAGMDWTGARCCRLQTAA